VTAEPQSSPRLGLRVVPDSAPLCLVTGATGYVGGRLVPALLDAGYGVRCVVRDPRRLRDHPWAGRVDVVGGDVTRPATLAAAFAGVEVAYYLVHALGRGPGFEDTDRQAAAAFAAAAMAAGCQRIVYLGGLIPPGVAAHELSPHLRSRAEVGQVFLDCAVPAVELRAAVIIGSGSASFEMLRYLTERLPVMVTPRWVKTRIQPVAVRDVLRYLVGVAGLPAEVNRSFDVGGSDVLTYRDMMVRYAQQAGLRRRTVISVPVLSPGLSSLWVGLVTPVPGGLARPLVESLRYEVVCREHDIAAYVPDPPAGLLGFDEAVRLALLRIRDADVATRWSSAGVPGAPSDPLPSDPGWSGGSLYEDRRHVVVAAPTAAVWEIIEGIGGNRGWYSWPLAWAARGWLDRLVGGVGLRRCRRDPHRLRIGDALDFWRVEEIEPGRLLRLRAEMRLPGLAWLELSVEDAGAGRSRYRQRALFHPRGLPGHLYWRSVAPLHSIVFADMADNVARQAATRATTVAAHPSAPPARRRRANPNPRGGRIGGTGTAARRR
jgi:uncharacterized protein YbjT (DUF2867 family)